MEVNGKPKDSTGRRKEGAVTGRRRKGGAAVRFLQNSLVMVLTTTMIATGVGGVIPNPLSQQLSETLSDVLPAEVAITVNIFLTQSNLPPLSNKESATPSPASNTEAPTLIDSIANLFDSDAVTAFPLATTPSSVTFLDSLATLLAGEPFPAPGNPVAPTFLDTLLSLASDEPLPLDYPSQPTFLDSIISVVTGESIPNPEVTPSPTFLDSIISAVTGESISSPDFTPSPTFLDQIVSLVTNEPLVSSGGNPPGDISSESTFLESLIGLVFETSVDGTNNTLNPGDVILSWLFPPASEPQLPSEQDIIEAAMTSIVATQPNLASLATNTPPPTLTLMTGNALTFTPTTPTGTVSSVVINPPPANNPAPAPTATPTYTPAPVAYMVSYNANGATSGTAPASQTKIQGVALTLATNSGGLALTGNIFNGWNTQTDGSGTHYVTGGTYSTDAAAILYAEWACSPSLTVTTNADSGPGSLRQAMIDVCTGGTITFTSSLSAQTITLTSGELAINKNLTVDGSALASRITISGNYSMRVFNISSGYTVTLKSLVIANGFVNGLRGGGISNDGTLTVMDSIFSGNTAANQWGGAIANQGALTVTNSIFSGNTVTNGDGAAIVNGAATLIVTGSTFSGNTAVAGGAIRNDGTATIANSTFSGNSVTPYWGGGIVNFGTLAVTNSTFSGNSSSNSGGGISNRNPGSLTLINTILTNSTGGDCVTDSGLGGTSKNNLITDTGASACNLINGTNGNVIGSSPNLGALASNGGSTQTFALLAGSPAIDAGDDSSCPSTDQRGSTRPQGLHCDIGAYESSFSAPTPAGHTISSFSLNGGGNAVTVTGGSPVTVDYSYQVWGDSSTCPGCNYQLVWGLENNWQYCSAWTSPSPGDSPGLTGTGSQFTITAPAPTGTYTIYSFSGQYTDCTAAETAYTSAGGTAQGTITVP